MSAGFPYATGWLHQEEDFEYLYEKSKPLKIVGTYRRAKSVDPAPYLTFRNQMHQPQCAAFAYVLCSRVCQWFKTGGGTMDDGKIVDLSPQYIYDLGRKEAGLGRSAGCTIQGVVQAGKKYGVCREQTFPFRDKDDLDIPREAFDEGEQHLMQSNSPAYSHKDIVEALFAGIGPTIIGIDFVESLAQHMHTEDPIEELSGESVGKHSVALAGVSERVDSEGRNYVYLFNHWEGWGDQYGRAEVSPSVVREWCSNHENAMTIVSDLEEYTAGRADFLVSDPGYQPQRW